MTINRSDIQREKDSADNGISVIIPLYNEETAIGSVLDSLLRFFSQPSLGRKYEIIVVDDGSIDKSAAIAESFKGIRVIHRPDNMGYGAAIKAGVRAAVYDWVFTIDADGQHRPDDLRPFLVAQDEGYDLIIGNRQKGSHQKWIRQPGKMIMRMLANYLTGMNIPDVNSGMRLYRKDVFLEFLPLYPNGFSISTTTTLAFLGDGYNVKFVPIITHQRSGRTSSVHIVRDGFNALIMIMRAISLFNPLRVFIPASMICGVVGIAMTIFNISRYGRVPNTGVLMSLGALLIFLFGILADQFSLLRRQHSMKDSNKLLGK